MEMEDEGEEEEDNSLSNYSDLDED